MRQQPGGKIRVWIADCHGLVGDGLKAMLEKDAGIQVLAVAGKKRQCVVSYKLYKPDVAVMDMTLNSICCLDAMRRILAHDPNARILAISSRTDCITAVRVQKAGARGYLSIESTADILIEAVRTIAGGGNYIEPAIAQQMVWNKSGGEDNPFDILTGREFEIFLMLVNDQSLNEIAESLHLSRSTVANHHTHILRKLGVPNHVGLTKLAIRHGIVEA